jgi:hypothetical protein
MKKFLVLGRAGMIFLNIYRILNICSEADFKSQKLLLIPIFGHLEILNFENFWKKISKIKKLIFGLSFLVSS